jgi:hypothetical protein
LFYVMPATPESISPGTLLFCVCMRKGIRIAGDPAEPKLICNCPARARGNGRWTGKTGSGRELGGN